MNPSRGIDFPAIDLDTRAPTSASEYDLADETYRDLLRRLEKDKFSHVDAELQANIVSYFTNFRPKLRIASNSRRWAEDQSALNALKVMLLPRKPGDDKSEQFDTVPKAQ